MNKYYISINQLAEFTGTTEKGQKRIIQQQKKPNPFLIPWYQRTKASIKRYFKEGGDIKPILEGIEILRKKIPMNKRQRNDQRVSIEALERFLKMNLPVVLFEMDYSLIRAKEKCIRLSGVELKISPDIIIKGKLNGETVIGGIKIHICKNKPFDYTKSLYVANSIYKYLKEKVAQENDIVHPGLCFSLDIFSERLVPASDNPDDIIRKLEEYCEILKSLWDAA